MGAKAVAFERYPVGVIWSVNGINTAIKQPVLWFPETGRHFSANHKLQGNLAREVLAVRHVSRLALLQQADLCSFALQLASFLLKECLQYVSQYLT